MAAVSIAALYLGRVVFIPLTFALLFSLILTPIVSFLEKIKFPRLLAIFVVVLTLLGATSLIGWISSVQVVDLSNELPSYAQALQKKINATQSRRSVTFTRLSQTVKEIGRELVEAIPGSPAEQTKPGPHPLPDRLLLIRYRYRLLRPKIRLNRSPT